MSTAKTGCNFCTMHLLLVMVHVWERGRHCFSLIYAGRSTEYAVSSANLRLAFTHGSCPVYQYLPMTAVPETVKRQIGDLGISDSAPFLFFQGFLMASCTKKHKNISEIPLGLVVYKSCTVDSWSTTTAFTTKQPFQGVSERRIVLTLS